VPQDTNGKEDTYEYEPDGVGSCTDTSSTFNVESNGCVALISSGTSGEEAVFLDASEDGDDVFFLTTAKLVPQDVDNALDVYDAHVCGSEGVVCPAAVSSPPPCATADSCRSAPPPQPEIFGAAGSAAFRGQGNASISPSSVVKSKDLTRAQKLTKALRACRSKKGGRRDACEARAQKRLGPRSKPKSAKRRGH
jgi:hypothetical protein